MAWLMVVSGTGLPSVFSMRSSDVESCYTLTKTKVTIAYYKVIKLLKLVPARLELATFGS